MIKLRELLERHEDQTELQRLAMPYNMFHRAPEMKKIQLARLMLMGPHRHELSPAHVYHIILGLPKNHVLDIYNIAKRYLTPDQLADVEPQINTFYQQPGSTGI